MGLGEDEWMGGLLHGCLCECTDELTDGRIARLKGWVDGIWNGLVGEWIFPWVAMWMDGWIHCSTDG